MAKVKIMKKELVWDVFNIEDDSRIGLVLLRSRQKRKRAIGKPTAHCFNFLFYKHKLS